jgi:hypothetical protein
VGWRMGEHGDLGPGRRGGAHLGPEPTAALLPSAAQWKGWGGHGGAGGVTERLLQLQVYRWYHLAKPTQGSVAPYSPQDVTSINPQEELTLTQRGIHAPRDLGTPWAHSPLILAPGTPSLLFQSKADRQTSIPITELPSAPPLSRVSLTERDCHTW